MRSASVAGDQSPRDLVEEWMRLFLAADVDAIVGLYAPGATFTGTTTARFTTPSEDIRSYFVRVLHDRRPASGVVLDCWI